QAVHRLYLWPDEGRAVRPAIHVPGARGRRRRGDQRPVDVQPEGPPAPPVAVGLPRRRERGEPLGATRPDDAEAAAREVREGRRGRRRPATPTRRGRTRATRTTSGARRPTGATSPARSTASRTASPCSITRPTRGTRRPGTSAATACCRPTSSACTTSI